MRLHLIDGTFELYRAHFSKRPKHQTPHGQDGKATAGLISSLLTLLADSQEAVTHLAVAFDNPIRSFRNDLFAGYKSDLGVPPELRAQFDLAEEAVRSLGVTVWSMNEFEADDALATAAVKFAPSVDQVRILTPDKDLGQVLAGNTIVQVDRIREREITAEVFFEQRGIRPASVPDWLALVGDTADGIPGLEGWGDKSAANLLAVYPRLEEIPVDPTSWKATVRGADRLAKTLAENKQEALLYRTLATLRTDVPLAESLHDLRWKEAPPSFEHWCDAFGVPKLAARAPKSSTS